MKLNELFENYLKDFLLNFQGKKTCILSTDKINLFEVFYTVSSSLDCPDLQLTNRSKLAYVIGVN